MPDIPDEVNNRKRTEDVSKVRRDWNEEKTDNGKVFKMIKICTIEGCSGEHEAFGLCKKEQ